MKLKRHLIIGENGATKIMKGKPFLAANEICLQLDLIIPDALFQKPKLRAEITIPEEAAIQETISSEVVDNIKDIVEQATGLTIAVTVEEYSHD